jgi:hypothetical protein
MLSHVTLHHAQEACPIVKTRGAAMPALLARANETGVKIVGAFGARPQHRIFSVLKTDDVAKLNNFLNPALSWPKCEKDPVLDLTA